MRSGNPIESLAKSLYTAILDNNILPDIEYEYQTPKQRQEGVEGTVKKRRPYDYEVEVVQFQQTWSSTALGFGGIGGQAFTSAYTTIVILDKYCAVFYAGGYAYTVENTEVFWNDVKEHRVESIQDAKSKYKVINDRNNEG